MRFIVIIPRGAMVRSLCIQWNSISLFRCAANSVSGWLATSKHVNEAAVTPGTLGEVPRDVRQC